MGLNDFKKMSNNQNMEKNVSLFEYMLENVDFE